MITANISVNVEDEVEVRAYQVLRNHGTDLVTIMEPVMERVIRAIADEGQIPYEYFEDQIDEAVHEDILATLEESLQEAANPNTVRVSHADLVAMLNKQSEDRLNVHA